MSATQLAAFIVSCLVAGGLVTLATAVIWKLRPGYHEDPPKVLSLALGIFACVVFGIGAATANHDPNAPATNSTPHGCQPGTYDNGSSDDGPKCFPWPPGTGR